MREDLPQRKSQRLRGYDYSGAGMYFVTVCTYKKRCTLGEVCRGDPCGRPARVALTELGRVVEQSFSRVGQIYGVTVEKYVMMPNHLHFLFTIGGGGPRATARVAPTGPAVDGSGGDGRRRPPTAGLVVGGLKSLAANAWLRICKERREQMGPLWQDGYYDHIIRNEDDFLRVWTYMDENPAKWAEDRYYVKG